jgi:hypothetical protein
MFLSTAAEQIQMFKLNTLNDWNFFEPFQSFEPPKQLNLHHDFKRKIGSTAYS